MVEDLQKAEKSDSALKPKVLKTKNEVWIRFHQKQDRTGLLSDYVGQLYSLGLGIRHASIHTLPNVGVYDWFQVVTSKDLNQLAKILENSQVQPKTPPQVKLHSIQLISQDENEWLISFKGPDQAGLLAATAKALSEVGLSIKSARVHTWGRQIDDVFTVKADPKGSASAIEALKEKFQL
ncbi:PII uridylyl-transferase [compost metagenome]